MFNNNKTWKEVLYEAILFGIIATFIITVIAAIIIACYGIN